MVEERRDYGQDMEDRTDPLELEQSILESFETLQAKMNKLSQSKLQAMAEAKRIKAGSLKAELSSQADQVIEIVNDMRSKIIANVMGDQNSSGYLVGEADDYLKAFEE